MIHHRRIFFSILLIATLGGCSNESQSSASRAPAQAPAQPPAPAPAPAQPPAPAPAQAPAAAAPAATPAPTAAPMPTRAFKTEDTNIAGVVAEVTECARKDGVLSVKIRFRNTSGEKKDLKLLNMREYEMYYVTASSKKYFILKDSEGTYLTPQASSFGGLGVSLEPGGQYIWWAKYPAPPADVKTVTLYTPLTAPLEDIAVADS